MGKQKYPSLTTKSLDGISTVKKGREHYSHAKLDARNDKRRQEAAARQRHYESLTIAQRIALAKSRPGENKRELARLAKLEAIQVTTPKPAPLTSAQKGAKLVKNVVAAAKHATQHAS